MIKIYSTISIKIKRSKDIALIGLKKSKEWKDIPIYLLKSKGQKKQLISKDFSSINWQSMDTSLNVFQYTLIFYYESKIKIRDCKIFFEINSCIQLQK